MVEMKPKDQSSTTMKPQKLTRHVEGDKLIMVSDTQECILNCNVRSIILIVLKISVSFTGEKLKHLLKSILTYTKFHIQS